MIKICISLGGEVIERSLDPDRSPYTIGRTEENDISIPDPSVSRQHAQLVSRSNGWEIVDFQSTNGTCVGGLRVEYKILHPRDRLLFGSIHAIIAEDLESVRYDDTDVMDSDRTGLLSPANIAQATLIGKSIALTAVRTSIEKVALKGTTVMIQGETGTGKELVARAIHSASLVAAGPFIAVNCGALPESLVEREFFGHLKGAFSGADENSSGYLAQANGGTLFLDEVGELPLGAQTVLLRFLEDYTYTPLGGGTAKQSKLRLLTATNINLAAAVENKTFRSDLYHRLKVVEIHIPPLRERLGDVTLLAQHFARTLSIDMNIGFSGFTDEALRTLDTHSWPGNIRELRNTIESSLIAANLEPIDREHLKLGDSFVSVASPDRPLEDVEKGHIIAVLKDVGGNKAKASRILGISRTALYEKLDRFDLRN